jgi:small subunit ribosomal protein S13
MKSFKDFITFSQNNKGNLLNSITSVYGVNSKSLNKIKLLNGLPNFKKSLINPEIFIKLKDQLNFFFELEKNKIFLNVEKKKKIKNYSGMRHILKLPVRGQRTHTNSKTSRTNIKKEI